MKILKLILGIFFLINASFCFSQKAKSSTVNAFTYNIPENYIPKGYDSYFSKITLPENPIGIFVNDVYHSDHLEINYNAFFKEDIYNNLFASIDGLSKEKEYNNADLIIEAIIMNPRIDIIVKKEKPLVDYKGRQYQTPHSYNYSYGFEILFKITSQRNKEQIFSKKIKSSSKYKINSKNDRIIFFEKKNEAIKYAIKYIENTIITGEIYKDLMSSLGNNSQLKSDIQFSNYNAFYYLYKVSNKKKHTKIEPLNNSVSSFISQVKSVTQKDYNKIKNKENDKFKSQLSFEDNEDIKAYKLSSSKKSNIELINLVLNFEQSMNSINDFSNPETKAEKTIAWSALINNAHAFFMIGDFNKSLFYFNKAEDIDYNNDKTSGFKSKAISKKNKLKKFYNEQNQIKDDVNNIYLEFLKTFNL